MNKKSSQLLISLLGPESFRRKSLEYVQAARPCFAILKLGGEVVQDELEILTETCAFLTQEVGLIPAIVHGGGTLAFPSLESH